MGCPDIQSVLTNSIIVTTPGHHIALLVILVVVVKIELLLLYWQVLFISGGSMVWYGALHCTLGLTVDLSFSLSSLPPARRQSQLTTELQQAFKRGDTATVKRIERLLAPEEVRAVKHPWA